MKKIRKSIIMTFIIIMLLSLNIGFSENDKDIPVIRSIHNTSYTSCELIK